MKEKRFEEVRYDRPDYEAYMYHIEKYAQEIRNAENMENLCCVLEDFFEYRANVETMETLAFIRSYQNCTDKFYQEEMQYTQTKSDDWREGIDALGVSQ